MLKTSEETGWAAIVRQRRDPLDRVGASGWGCGASPIGIEGARARRAGKGTHEGRIALAEGAFFLRRFGGIRVGRVTWHRHVLMTRHGGNRSGYVFAHKTMAIETMTYEIMARERRRLRYQMARDQGGEQHHARKRQGKCQVARQVKRQVTGNGARKRACSMEIPQSHTGL